MSDYQAKPDTGSMFATQTKKTPKSPDYFGSIAVNLKDMTNIKTEDGLTIIKISGWKKVAKNGKRSCHLLWIVMFQSKRAVHVTKTKRRSFLLTIKTFPFEERL